MRNIHIGLQLYGVRETLAADFEGTLRAVAGMGYEYVEFAGECYGGRTGEEIKNLLDSLGLKCLSVHRNLSAFDHDPDGEIEFLKTFGVKYVVIPWYDKENLVGEAGKDSFRKFTDFGRRLAAHGMKLAYHNHDFEFEKDDGKYIHDRIFENVPAELIDPELDTCWVAYAGLDPAAKIRQFAGRVEIVHLKDFVCKKLAGGPAYELVGKENEKISKEDNGFEFRPVGMGRQDFAAILRACDECGTELAIVEQDRTYGGMTELEAAKLSRDYLKNAFGL